MIRSLIVLMLAAMTAFAPSALADGHEPAPEEEGENAWVEDCPPDMMCAMQQPTEDNETAPIAMGPEDCIECSQPPQHNPDEDYVKAPEGSEAGVTSVEDEGESNSVPVPAGVLALIGMAVAVGLLLSFRRS